MTSPKISVLVPTYNYARYLPEAVESVLEQDWRDFELIIADDASADDSWRVISRYAAKDSRIRAQQHRANLGMVQNWNWCLSEARGEYVKFVFGDDKLVKPYALRRLMELMETNPSATVAASARVVIGSDSQGTETWDAFGATGVHEGVEVIARCLETGVNQVGEPSAVMFRRRDATRGFDLQYRQLVDLEMWFALLEKGGFAYTAEPLCAFRKHAEQQTQQNVRSGILAEETARLVWNYHEKPYLQTQLEKLLFTQVYRLRKYSPGDGEHREMEAKIMSRLGPRTYRKLWIRHKLTRPWINAWISATKRLRGAHDAK